MKVAALFLDYDGTIAPADATREKSAVPRPLYSVLERVSAKIPVAMITAKDMGFVRPRTMFAWGWSAALGLETRLRDGSGELAKVAGRLSTVTEGVRAMLPAGVIVEEKRGSDGSLLGVSLDWSRMDRPPRRELDVAFDAFSDGGFQVDRDDAGRFIDVYASRTDKGAALRALVKLLDAGRPVMYLGDTLPDNEAFEAADIAICVNHGRKDGRLRCQVSIGYEEVPKMLTSLLESGFEFPLPPTQVGGAR